MKLTMEGTYRFTWKEHAQCIAGYLSLWMLVGWLFYDMIVLAFIAFPTYYAAYKVWYNYKCFVCARELQLEFKEMMLSVYSSLSAGTTLEESMKRALDDAKRSMKPEARMIQELILICQKMERNVPVNKCLEDMALRCNSADMISFSQVIAIGKRQGSNLIQLVRDSVGKIQRRIEIRHEIEGIIGAKRGEFVFMCLIPIGIILYMRCFSPEFTSILYGNLMGGICMTACLGLYIFAIFIGVCILKKD